MNPSGRSQLLRGLESGWSALSYVISGVLVWGGIGMGLDVLLGTEPLLLIIGVLVGNAAGIYLLYLRYPVGELPHRSREADHAA